MKQTKKDITKTEFLFESDAEKVVLRQAEKELKPKLYKKIIENFIFIAALITITFTGILLYKNTLINRINAKIVKQGNQLPTEKINEYSKNLKIVNEDFNKYTLLVNNSNPLNLNVLKQYNYVKVTDNLYDGIKLEEETYKAYLKLKENLNQRGYYINIKSGFYKSNENNITSEHYTGLSFDYIISDNKGSYESNYESDAFSYLENTAHLYGFIIRYPKNKEKVTGYNYAPEHLRYVGVDTAKYLKKNALTLEEYYN